jgi:3-deoxy-D-manno-octulosonate 8-phosphate phosphatase (KDO 8-P phosphatase)
VHYVAVAPAGRGAAREVCELLMRAQGSLERALQEYLA